jgi:hypothetical protein
MNAMKRPGSGKESVFRLTYPRQSKCVLFSCLTFALTEEANLDEGAMWPTAFALSNPTATEYPARSLRR